MAKGSHRIKNSHRAERWWQRNTLTSNLLWGLTTAALGAGGTVAVDVVKDPVVARCADLGAEMMASARQRLGHQLGQNAVAALRGEVVLHESAGRTVTVKNPLYETGVSVNGACTEDFVAGLTYDKQAGRQRVHRIVPFRLNGSVMPHTPDTQTFRGEAFPPRIMTGMLKAGEKMPILFVRDERAVQPAFDPATAVPIVIGEVTEITTGPPSATPTAIVPSPTPALTAKS